MLGIYLQKLIWDNPSNVATMCFISIVNIVYSTMIRINLNTLYLHRTRGGVFLWQLKATTGSLSCLEGEGEVRGVQLPRTLPLFPGSIRVLERSDQPLFELKRFLLQHFTLVPSTPTSFQVSPRYWPCSYMSLNIQHHPLRSPSISKLWSTLINSIQCACSFCWFILHSQ